MPIQFIRNSIGKIKLNGKRVTDTNKEMNTKDKTRNEMKRYTYTRLGKLIKYHKIPNK